ncbi:hypothetical protein LTR53_009822 [Teratosphaeriaceae sp. CCFEE 6253]|nr:hypothetical protein LTR53_009822 [Teratosphaeriaceae sp. CCFEE 6253]
MSWLRATPSQPTPSTPEASQDGGYIAPDRTGRQKCWDGRDAFFACLETHGIIDSVKQDDKARKACAPELGEFERTCASSWVTYFKKRRVMEYQRDMTIRKLNAENAQSIDMGGGGGAKAGR